MSDEQPTRPDVIVLMTDEERAAPAYESDEVAQWRRVTLVGAQWFEDHAVNFRRHYTGSLACVPSRPTIFTGQYPEVHGVTQTDGLGKMADDTRMRWLREGDVPTLGHWFRTAGYDTHYDGKWHLSHADLHDADGNRIDTNDDDGNVLADGVEQYRRTERLDPYGFSGWIGPEPHGGRLRDAGVRRDPLIADRVVAWLEDRYTRRAAGDADALRPFLLVASFVNPHDIVLFPAWVRRGNPLDASPLDPPHVPEAPTQHEDLATKPAAQIAFRAAYPSGYGPARAVAGTYTKKAQEYRDLYHRLHAEVDAPLDRVRRAVTDQGSDAVIVKTSDHGDLLGAHGGLHQKWFNLYDEATRVPFSIARVGAVPTSGAVVEHAPTSHVDIVPTLLAAAGIDESMAASVLEQDFTEVHLLPGTNLMRVVDDPSTADPDRAVYLMTNDNMLEGDSGASGIARRLRRTQNPPLPLRISTPAHVASNFEGVVCRVDGVLWKLVRVFDDPATWTEPGVRHLAASGGPGPATYRSEPLPDQWELYDLDHDPIEAHNRWHDVAADSAITDVFDRMCDALKAERARAVPERNHPWPYASRRPTAGPMTKTPPPPARALRKLVQKLGMHPDDPDATSFDLAGRRALVVATNVAWLDIAKPTGVFASEMTVPYYAFLDAGMDVDLASPSGGMVAVDPKSLKPVIRTPEDDRFLVDEEFRAKVSHSLAIADLDMSDYDIVFLAGGWGAAFDFGFSEALGEKMTEANGAGLVIGGVCHGPLGLLNAKAADGSPLVAGRRISAVTDKQVNELGIEATPHHPERELRGAGARFESETKFRDPLANHWVVDGNLVTGQNQNAGPMVAREMMQILVDNDPEAEYLMSTDSPRYGTIDQAYGMQLATTPAAEDGPVWMVNLMKYRERADYADGRGSSISGREADNRYTPLDSLAAVGAAPVFFGDVDQQLLGDDTTWDRIGVVKYLTRKSFIDMQSLPSFQESHHHKDAGMERTIVMGTRPMAIPEAPAGFAPLDWADVPYPPTAEDGPVVVLHVLRFEDAASAHETPTHMQQYQGEAAKVALRHGVRINGWFAVEGTIIGDGRSWHQVRFNEFPSKAAFMAVVTDPARLAAQHDHREVAIADTYTMIVRASLNELADSTGQ